MSKTTTTANTMTEAEARQILGELAGKIRSRT